MNTSAVKTPVRLTAVVFDLAGVIFRYAPERRLAALARTTGRPAQELQKSLMDSGYSRSCDAGRLDRTAAYEKGVRLLGQRMSFERFRDHWISAFEPDPAVVALAQRLRRHLSLAALTNNSDLVRSGLEQRYPEVMGLFRPQVFSADVGLLKPDPRLFRTLLDLMGLDAAQVLYVDDQPACAAAAESLGMTACRFRSAADLEAQLAARGLLH